jgi:hypothetical protein
MCQVATAARTSAVTAMVGSFGMRSWPTRCASVIDASVAWAHVGGSLGPEAAAVGVGPADATKEGWAEEPAVLAGADAVLEALQPMRAAARTSPRSGSNPGGLRFMPMRIGPSDGLGLGV